MEPVFFCEEMDAQYTVKEMELHDHDHEKLKFICSCIELIQSSFRAYSGEEDLSLKCRIQFTVLRYIKPFLYYSRLYRYCLTKEHSVRILGTLNNKHNL